MNQMSGGNPYEFRSAHGDSSMEEIELLDAEARVRIAGALDVSFRPMRAIATVALFVAVLLTFLAGTVLVMGIANRNLTSNISELSGYASILGMLLVLAVAAFLVAFWLWACATAIGRARNRLTVASLASAVQAQSLFWRKLGILSVVTVATILVLTLLLLVLSP